MNSLTTSNKRILVCYIRMKWTSFMDSTFLLLILMNSVDVCVHLSAYSPRTGAKWVIVWRKPDMFIDHVVFKKKRKKEAYQSNVHIQIE